ncbi:MAG: CPBP family intramembrane metalloprotease, partial [Akkermansiaceae bacterium]|nr:CPBP family intramembrane metalloprotease [Akkermansiaceae bacterium]
MSDLEYQAIGVAFAVCAAMLFFGAVPYYASRHLGPGKPPPLPRGNVSTVGFGVVDVVGVSLFFGWYALNWSASREGPDLDEVDNLPLLLLSQLGFQVFMVVVVVFLLFWRTNLVDAFGVRWRRWPLVFLIAPLTVLVMWSFMAVLDAASYNQWITDLVGGDPQQEAVKLLGEGEVDLWTLVIMTVVACIGAPLAEEVVFRGYLYPAMKRFSNIPLAILFTGLLFGAVHLNLAALLPLTVLGVVLALLYEATGSLWAPVAVHFLFNAGTVTI